MTIDPTHRSGACTGWNTVDEFTAAPCGNKATGKDGLCDGHRSEPTGTQSTAEPLLVCPDPQGCRHDGVPSDCGDCDGVPLESRSTPGTTINNIEGLPICPECGCPVSPHGHGEQACAHVAALRELLREGAHHLYRVDGRASVAAYERWRENVRAFGIHPDPDGDNHGD